MSAIQRLPTVYCAVEEIRIELRLSPKLMLVELSTFMIAFPASLIRVSFEWLACAAPTKLKPMIMRGSNPISHLRDLQCISVRQIVHLLTQSVSPPSQCIYLLLTIVVEGPVVKEGFAYIFFHHIVLCPYHERKGQYAETTEGNHVGFPIFWSKGGGKTRSRRQPSGPFTC